MHIHVGIVESHDAALPFYYSLIRKKLIPSKDLAFIHFDAHPDLSIPSHSLSSIAKEGLKKGHDENPTSSSSSSSVSQWNDLFVLQSLLADTEGGIAEWILPLIYNQILKKVVWVRNHFCSQFTNGLYKFCIGDAVYGLETAPRACISLAEPYYNVENVVVEATEMIPNTVKHGSFEVLLVDELDTTTLKQCYILDICLDYFSTENPFFKELKQLITADLSSLDGDSCDRIISNILTVFDVTQKQFKSASDKQSYEVNISALSDILHSGNLVTPSSITDEYAVLLNQFHVNMQLLSAPTKQYIWSHRTVLNLPHYIATEAQLEHSLNEFKQHLSLFVKRNGLPSAISIARSVDDGYTPQSCVSNLQSRVLDILKSLVDATHPLVVHELTGADAWHDSFTLFLNKNCKRYVSVESDVEGTTTPSPKKIQKV